MQLEKLPFGRGVGEFPMHRQRTEQAFGTIIPTLGWFAQGNAASTSIPSPFCRQFLIELMAAQITTQALSRAAILLKDGQMQVL
jgi:hypothetical protein